MQCASHHTQARIGPHKHVAQQLHPRQLLHAQNGPAVGLLGHVYTGQRAQVDVERWQVGGQARYAFVDIGKELEVSQMHHHEKKRLKRLTDTACRVKQRGQRITAW